ncbi:NACHT domain-containing protein [Longispora albida]|uniref:NACHT domain-containing protein n=1 Tax=Longispora albida TaxID=203523 RepID=UPI0003606B71|nr:NACHT domain-containing protein [Longispora albida]
MTALGTAAFVLGTTIAKTACSLWLGGSKLTETLSHQVIDEAASRLRTPREQRQFRRFQEQLAEQVTAKLESFLAHEFGSFPEHERTAALASAHETLARSDLHIIHADFDPTILYKGLAPLPSSAVLSEPATALCNLVLRESCTYLVETVRALPGTTSAALEEVLRRETRILADLEEALTRLPIRRGVRDFEADYRHLTGNHFDRIELFGATVNDESRLYPLSVAYLSLTLSGRVLARLRPDRHGLPHGMPDSGTPTLARVDEALACSDRLFIRGQAGIGKTTLLHWIAVQSARDSFTGKLDGWRDSIPFVIPLRRYANEQLPAPEQFITESNQHIAAEMPPGWVQQHLRSGTAIVLIDGVDELPAERRTEARNWLADLVAAFPRARYVVTSRPAAVPEEWLNREDFDVADLEPMSPMDVRVFVERWHAAMRDTCIPDQAAELDQYQSDVLHALDTRSHLRRLAGYPLLCALMCALHRDRRGQLPENRMELYEVALHMLLERRDKERHIQALPLTRTERSLLLQQVAYWLIRNSLSDAPAEAVEKQIALRLSGMRGNHEPAAVLRHLLERTGLLREPVHGRIDFVHRTFQEYLAAKAAIDADDRGTLISHAHLDQWREVVVMAAGHASAPERERLLTALLTRAETSPQRRRDALLLIAIACLEVSPELPPTLRAHIDQASNQLLPPKSMTTAHVIAATGELALDLLARTIPSTPREVAATIRAAAETGDPAALPLIGRLAARPERIVHNEVIRAWEKFDPEEYARLVLANAPLTGQNYPGSLDVDDPRFLAGLEHIRQLSHLHCDFGEHSDGDLAFLAELPELPELWYRNSSVANLAPLAKTRLEWLTIAPGFSEPARLDVAPLRDWRSIRRFYLYSPASNLHSLGTLPHLVSLAVAPESEAQIDELTALGTLNDLQLEGPPDLTDLSSIAFLKAPRYIFVRNCLALADISTLTRWSNSISWLGIDARSGIDLSPLSQLGNLHDFQLLSPEPIDLRPAADIPWLETLRLHCPEADLSPMRKSRVLTRIFLYSSGNISSSFDLAPLCGMQLTIHVARGVKLTGLQHLGQETRIRAI